jgi:cell division septal protein FtsQ
VADLKREPSRSVVRESLRARRQKRARRALVAYAIAGAVIYGGAWHLSHHPSFAVAAVTVDGNVVSDDETVARAARGAMSSAALSVVPMTNAYLARGGRIEEAIEAALPEVATASVSKEGKTIRVAIEERARFGYWCRGAEAEECFALDADGVIFAREAAPADATRFGGQIAAADPVRERYVPEEPWANLRQVVEALHALGFSPTRASSPDGVDFRISLAEGPELVIDVTHSGAQAIENLQIALDDESLSALREYGYADLRLPHKVFLRAGGPVAESIDEPSTGAGESVE